MLAVMTVWPSGLRRWLKAPFRKGVGSNPTAVSLHLSARFTHFGLLTVVAVSRAAVRPSDALARSFPAVRHKGALWRHDGCARLILADVARAFAGCLQELGGIRGCGVEFRRV